MAWSDLAALLCANIRDNYEKNRLLHIIREHNRLNGFRFVVIEFSLVTLAAIFISVGGLLHRNWPMAFIGAGIAANAMAVIAIAVAQIRDHEQGDGLLKFRSAQFRADIRSQHPKLSTHTVVLVVSVLMPFLLAVLLYVQRFQASSKL